MKLQIFILHALLFFAVITRGKPEQIGERAGAFRNASNKIDTDKATEIIDTVGPRRANNAFTRVNEGKEPYTTYDKAKIKVGEMWDDVKSKFTETRGSIGREKTVLGKYPEYLERADELNAHRFDIPTSVWKEISEPERWAANKKLLEWWTGE